MKTLVLSKKSLDTIKIVILALVVGLGVNYVYAAWINPPGNPPSCPSTIEGCNTPLNIGGTGQIKAGGLTLNTGGAANGLIVANGNVGIGTASPTAALQVHESDTAATADLFKVTKSVSGSQLSNTIFRVTAAGGIQITAGEPGAGKVLTSDETGHVSWQEPAAGGSAGNVVYISPVKIFDLEDTTGGAGGSGRNYSVGYGTNLIPTTAKSVILRVFAQANSWRIEVSIGADGLPMQKIAIADGGNNSDDAASDSVVMEIPYSQNRNLTASWRGVGSTNRTMDESEGQYAEVYVIGYRQ